MTKFDQHISDMTEVIALKLKKNTSINMARQWENQQCSVPLYACVKFYVSCVCVSLSARSSEQCIALQRIAAHCSALQRIAAHCSALHCSAVQCIALQRNAMQCNAMQCNAMQCNAMQCNAMQCNAMQCNAMHHAPE